MTKQLTAIDRLEVAVYEALGESSALFMSQPIKGTEIVMPITELVALGRLTINRIMSDLLADIEGIIGEDEAHDNGQKIVNDPSSCMGCINPDERFCRNALRQELRTKLREYMGVEG